MAELRTEHSTFRLMPLGFEFSDEEWVRSELSLRLVVNRQALLVKPLRAATLSLHSYQQLLAGAHSFLDTCASEDNDLFDDIEPFVFVPAELDFEFALLDGDLSPNGKGEVTVRVMIRIDGNPPAYVGSTLSVDASQFRQFLNTLEEEIDQIVRRQAASAFVTAKA